MTLSEIIDSVQYLVDEAGNRTAVQLDLSAWQDLLAYLNELEDERRWDEAFANSEDLLAQLADEALADH